MGKGARKLRKCFNDLTQHVYASEISKHIQKNTEQLKVIILFPCLISMTRHLAEPGHYNTCYISALNSCVET